MAYLESFEPTHKVYDVAVIGAGPVGCLTAVSFAAEGAEVLLLEANPKSRHRFAGEWLHPKAVAALQEVGFTPRAETCFLGEGFVVHPADGSAPLSLPYGQNRNGMSFEHHVFVEQMRSHARQLPGIDYVEQVRLVQIDEQGQGIVRLPDGRTCALHARRLVGADGRHSDTRRLLLPEDEVRKIGYIGGMTLENIDLPLEGMGHVCLGGYGPFLMYRVAADKVRVVIDLPLEQSHLRRNAVALSEFVPASIAGPIRNALCAGLQQGQIVWTPGYHRSRLYYGTPEVTLVGDAVGSFHPLTAAGMTMGFLDARMVAQVSFKKYAARRNADALVPELLSSALRRVFAGDDLGAKSIMDTVVHAWRTDPDLCKRTMDFLGAEDTSPVSFSRTFSALGARALVSDLLANRTHRNYTARQILRAYGRWARWPLLAAGGPAFVAIRPFLSGNRVDHQFPSEIPDQEEILARDAYIENDHDYCMHALAQVSRTFVEPIRMLDEPVQTAVMCGYLLCRIADTIEDDQEFSVARKSRLFSIFRGVLRGEEPVQSFATQFMLCDNVEYDLARNMGRVMRVFHSLPVAMQRIGLRWVEEMSRGMELYTRREPDSNGFQTLLTLEDLQRYCYYVAGTVGHLLTELFEIALPDLSEEQRSVLKLHAENFGMGLQLTNILKDITDDLGLGRSYIPQSLAQQVGLEPYQLYTPENLPIAHQAVGPMFDLAAAQLRHALEYTLAIPASARGIRLFCLLPLWMAAASLVHARNNDAMFDSNQPVKISRAQVGELIQDCMQHYSDDSYLQRQLATMLRPLARLQVVA